MAATIQKAYQLSISVADSVWNLIQMWTVFSRTIVGNSFVTSLDNLTVNLAKTAKMGNDNTKRYILMAKENLIECFIWNDKARRRKLLSNQDYQLIYVQLNKLESLLNKVEE